MRLERPRLQFGMELHPDEPRMVVIFDDFRQHPIRRQAGESEAMLLEPVLVGGIDLVAMAVAFGNLGGTAIDTGNPAAAIEHCRISAKPHRAAELARLR